MANNVGYVHTGNTAAPEAPGQYEGVSTPPGPGGGQVTSVEPSAEEGAWDAKPAPTAPAAPAAPATEEGAWDTAPTPTAPTDKIGGVPESPTTIRSSDSALTMAGKIAEGVPAGIGEGVFQTARGAAGLFGIHNAALDKLAGVGEQASGSEQVGEAAQTIGEFFLGDAALKGLSLGEKFLQVAPVLKAMENFPRAAQALRLGINIGKAGTELSTEDRAAIKASPVLARMVGAGYDALRAGAVQTAQTEVNTGGAGGVVDQQYLHEHPISGRLEGALGSAEQGASMTAGAGLIGGTTGMVGGVLAKGGEAAEKASALRAVVTGTTGGASPASVTNAPENADADMRRIYHYSDKPVEVADPEVGAQERAAGKGAKGKETGRLQVSGTQFGNSGYKEGGVTNRPFKQYADVDYNTLYNIEDDPLKLGQQARTLFEKNGDPVNYNLEKLIQDNGYKGLQNEGGRVVKYFDKLPLHPDLGVKEVAATPESAAAFHDAVNSTKDAVNSTKDALDASKDPKNLGLSPQLIPYEPADYEGMRLFTSPDKKAGFAIKPDGDIVSVFSHPDNPRGAAEHLLDVAVANGGNKLDAFDTFLPKVYAKEGFKVVARMPWNDTYAPADWDAGAMSKYNGGKPDVVFMAHDPAASKVYTPGEGVKVDSYDQGAQLQDQAIARAGATPVTGPAPTDAQLQGQFRQTVTGALAKPASEAQQALDAAQGKLANAESTARQAATGAPEHAAITAQAQAATKAAYTKLGTDYAQAAEQAKGLIGGTTVDYGGSPLHQAAQAIANEGKTAATPLDEAFAISRPGSAKANAMVDKLADVEGTISLDDEGNSTQLTAQNVMDYAKNLKERLRNTGWVTDEQRADRDVYHKLLDGTHETLAQLAQASGNPQAMDVVQNMNSAYREGIGRFNNPDVKALLQGNVNDVFKRLTGGGTSVADINTAKSAIGDKAFGSLAEASLSRLAADSVDKATGEFSYKNFFNKWNGIPADVRQAMFADSVRAGAIQDDIATVQKLNTSGAVPEATQKLKDINQTIESLVGNGDTNVLLKDPERVAAMSKVVGADGMAELGKSIIQNQMLKSATTGVGEKAVVGIPNAGKVLDWMLSMKDSPEVTDALFKPTPEASANFEKLMADLKTVQSVHNMTKFGIFTPMAATGVGMGVVAHGPLAIMLGTMVGAGGAVAARDIVDKISNSPAMWRTIAFMDRRAAGPVAGAIGQGTRYAAGRGLGLGVNYLQHAMTGAADSLNGGGGNSETPK